MAQARPIATDARSARVKVFSRQGISISIRSPRRVEYSS